MRMQERYIESYVHQGRTGVLLELGVGSRTSVDFEEFSRLAKDLAMHIAASDPADVNALLLQPFVKDLSVTVAQRLSQVSAELRDEVTVRKFIRWDAEAIPPTARTPPDSDN